MRTAFFAIQDIDDGIPDILFIITFPLFAMNIIVVLQNKEPLELNSELKKLAIGTFIFTVIFGLGLII